MTNCPTCGFAVPGIAAECPRCGAAILSTRLVALGPPLATATKPKPSGVQWALIVGISLLVAGLVAFAMFYATLVIFFCLDFGNSGACDAQDASATRFFTFVGLPTILIGAALTGFGTWRLVRRHNRGRGLRHG